MLVIEGTYLDTVKIICEKSTVNIILNCEKLKNSPIDPEFNKNIYFYHFFFPVQCWKSLPEQSGKKKK